MFVAGEDDVDGFSWGQGFAGARHFKAASAAKDDRARYHAPRGNSSPYLIECPVYSAPSGEGVATYPPLPLAPGRQAAAPWPPDQAISPGTALLLLIPK
jgi:hypothetical protein